MVYSRGLGTKFEASSLTTFHTFVVMGVPARRGLKLGPEG